MVVALAGNAGLDEGPLAPEVQLSYGLPEIPRGTFLKEHGGRSKAVRQKAWRRAKGCISAQ